MDMRIRGMSSSHNAKISIVDLTESMTKIVMLQKSNPLVTIALSKFTAANALLGMELKNGERVTANITTTDGPVKKMITEFQNNKVRSYAQVNNFNSLKILASDLDPVKATVGKNGQLVISQDLYMRDAYASGTELVDGSIDADFMNFLSSSNQVSSIIITHAALNADMTIKKVVGILIQLLPTHTEADIEYLALKLGNTKHVTDVLMRSTNYEALIKEIIEDAIILEQYRLDFECTCSEEKIMNSIRMIGQSEIKEIIAEGKNIEVVCEFCNKKYNVITEDIKKLLD